MFSEGFDVSKQVAVLGPALMINGNKICKLKDALEFEKCCCLSYSPPAAEYQSYQPTFSCWLRTSWEKVVVRDTTTRRLQYWANGLFYPSWNRLQLIGSSVANCQALT